MSTYGIWEHQVRLERTARLLTTIRTMATGYPMFYEPLGSSSFSFPSILWTVRTAYTLGSPFTWNCISPQRQEP